MARTKPRLYITLSPEELAELENQALLLNKSKSEVIGKLILGQKQGLSEDQLQRLGKSCAG